MTRTDSQFSLRDLQLMLAHLLQEFGPRRFLFVLLKELMRPQPKRPHSTQILTDHLRRDVGLPPKIKPTTRWWETLN